MLPETLSKHDQERVEQRVNKWMSYQDKLGGDRDARAKDWERRLRSRAAIEVVTDWARQWLKVKGVPDTVQPMYETLAWFLYKLSREDGPPESKSPRAASLLRAWAAQKTDPAVLDAMCREVLGFAPGDEPSLP